ncbi:MAG: 5-hydroxyisourate hydrolase [Crocinitomicaceae bacterium]|jgi:5-hydroxyisourate hydrolase
MAESLRNNRKIERKFMKSPITTHILDVNLGKPAANVDVTLYRKVAHDFVQIAKHKTNSDGRIIDWMGEEERQSGIYRVVFDTDGYFNQLNQECLYPSVTIDFRLTAPDQHYHIPLLLSANGFSTYRGS